MNELKYFGAFVLGMAFLWLSGHAGIAISASHPGWNYVINFLISGLVYGLGAAAIVYFFAGRRLLPALLLGLLAAVLAPLLAIAIGKLVAGHINSKNEVGLFTFGLYLIFGAIYPVLIAIARKLALRRSFDVPAK